VITHPEKVLFPDSAITKGELCAYYEAVAPLMIPLRTAALAVRELLDEFGLPSYVKTSGSKGFHILIPLDGEGDAESVRRFAHGAGAVLVKRHPRILTQEFIKADRGDRIFVDTGRNLPGATFAAVYAVRAKPGAPISAPCTWAELQGGIVGPRTFTLRTMAARIDRVGELWSDMDARRCSLRDATAELRTMLTDADRSEALAASTRRPVSRKAPRKRTRKSTRSTPSKTRR
jgi:bifunctional non-homologous end joining protein LigD